MSNAKNTPGPWKVSLNKHDECEVHSDGGEWIAVVPHQCVTALVPIQEANARLIASAPELLAACVEFVRKVDAGEAKSTKSYEQMKQAIAKATQP